MTKEQFERLKHIRDSIAEYVEVDDFPEDWADIMERFDALLQEVRPADEPVMEAAAERTEVVPPLYADEHKVVHSIHCRCPTCSAGRRSIEALLPADAAR